MKGSNVGYDNLEIKKSSTEELKNILNSIIVYYTCKTRQKIQNSNFTLLYKRIKNELKRREDQEKINSLSHLFNNYQPIPMKELKIPDFFNDKLVKAEKSTTCSTTTNSYLNNINLEDNEQKNNIDRKYFEDYYLNNIENNNQKITENQDNNFFFSNNNNLMENISNNSMYIIPNEVNSINVINDDYLFIH